MNKFDPLAPAQALFSLFTCGPLGFTTHFFVEPQTPAPSGTPDRSRADIDASRDAAPTGRSRPSIAPPPLERRGLPATNGPQWLSHRFEHGGQTHRFKLYVPNVYHGQPLPMIVMLHGAQQDPDDFAAGAEMNEAAEAHGYIVRLPGAVGEHKSA
jgi:hypothetical protein